jgi:hypothetical protein
MRLVCLVLLVSLVPLLRTFLQKYSKIVFFAGGKAVNKVFIKVKASEERA